jgi:hypothetical protein
MVEQRSEPQQVDRSGESPASTRESSQNAGDAASQGGTNERGMGAALQGKARDVADSVEGTPGDMADAARENVAAALEGGAERLSGIGGSGPASAATGTAAEGLRETAAYLRENEPTEIWSDIEGYVKRYPGRSVIAAVAAGLMLGRILRR